MEYETAGLVIAVLGVSFAAGALAIRCWPAESSQWKAFSMIYGLLPAAITIVFTFLTAGRLSFGEQTFSSLEWWSIGLAIAIPPLVFAANLFVQLRVGSGAVRLGTRPLTLLPGLLLSFVILIPLVAGEEIAWRGFLQGPLTRQLGLVPGIVVLGLIWGIWHAPVALRGHNLRSMFWAEAFVLYPFMCVVYSFPMAFLTLETGSIWPALVFHATNNALGSVAASVIEQRRPGRAVVALVGVGAFLIVPFALLVAR